jgi:hypothetical protein
MRIPANRCNKRNGPRERFREKAQLSEWEVKTLTCPSFADSIMMTTRYNPVKMLWVKED